MTRFEEYMTVKYGLNKLKYLVDNLFFIEIMRQIKNHTICESLLIEIAEVSRHLDRSKKLLEQLPSFEKDKE